MPSSNGFSYATVQTANKKRKQKKQVYNFMHDMQPFFNITLCLKVQQQFKLQRSYSKITEKSCQLSDTVCPAQEEGSQLSDSVCSMQVESSQHCPTLEASICMYALHQIISKILCRK